MTHDNSRDQGAHDPLRDAVRHRRDTSDRARVAELRADILSAATSAPRIDGDTDDQPNEPGDRGRRRLLVLAAAAAMLVLAGVAAIVFVGRQPTAEATAREILINAADATRAGGTARYEMSVPYSIALDSDFDAPPLARYTLDCVFDFDYDARGSVGHCDSQLIEGSPLFDFLEGSYELLILEDRAYERDSADDPWITTDFTGPGTPLGLLFTLLDPVSTLDLFTGESADVAAGQVTRVPGTDTRRVETTVRTPFENEIADADIETDLTAVIDADDQVIRLEASGVATTDVPFASRWPFELRIVRTAVDVEVDLAVD